MCYKSGERIAKNEKIPKKNVISGGPRKRSCVSRGIGCRNEIQTRLSFQPQYKHKRSVARADTDALHIPPIQDFFEKPPDL